MVFRLVVIKDINVRIIEIIKEIIKLVMKKMILQLEQHPLMKKK